MSDALAIEGTGLRVVFRRLGDRVAHAIERLQGASWSTILESLEGGPDDVWPPSPPLQELHFEGRPDGRRLALLVGRAGASHWSLSVEWDPLRARLSFDAACRVRSTPAWLGSRYHLMSAADVGEPIEAPFSDAADIELPGVQLRSESTGEQPACNLVQQDGQLQLHPAPVAAPWPKTSRWRYSLEAASP